MTRLRVFPALFMALVLLTTACGGGVGPRREEGEVVAISTWLPLDPFGNVDEGELTTTVIDVDLGDEVVEATVTPEDQANPSSLFSQGDLSEGDRVVVERTAGDFEWVFVEVAGGN